MSRQFERYIDPLLKRIQRMTTLTLLYNNTPKMAIDIPTTLIADTGFLNASSDTEMTTIRLVALATE